MSFTRRFSRRVLKAMSCSAGTSIVARETDLQTTTICICEPGDESSSSLLRRLVWVSRSRPSCHDTTWLRNASTAPKIIGGVIPRDLRAICGDYASELRGSPSHFDRVRTDKLPACRTSRATSDVQRVTELSDNVGASSPRTTNIDPTFVDRCAIIINEAFIPNCSAGTLLRIESLMGGTLSAVSSAARTVSRKRASRILCTTQRGHHHCHNGVERRTHVAIDSQHNVTLQRLCMILRRTFTPTSSIVQQIHFEQQGRRPVSTRAMAFGAIEAPSILHTSPNPLKPLPVARRTNPHPYPGTSGLQRSNTAVPVPG